MSDIPRDVAYRCDTDGCPHKGFLMRIPNSVGKVADANTGDFYPAVVVPMVICLGCLNQATLGFNTDIKPIPRNQFPAPENHADG